MRDCGVDRDHEIQLRDERSGVREVADVLARVADVRRAGRVKNLTGPPVHLQADEVHARHIQQWKQLPQLDRTHALLEIRCSSSPHQPDFEPRAIIAEPVAPELAARRVSREIGDGVRDGFRLRFENERQAEHGHMQVERRERLAIADDFAHAFHGGEKAGQRRLALDHHHAATFRDQRRVSDELDGIAEALL